MMASGRYAAAAAVLVAAPQAGAHGARAAAQSDPTPRGASEQQNLYGPSPTFAAHELSGQFYKAYGSSISALELGRGAQLGALASAQSTAPAARARAGLAGSRSPLKILLLGAILAVLAFGAVMISGAPTARASAPDGFFGITTEDAYTGKSPYAARQLGRQHAAGFTIARQVFRWNEIEYARNRYDFSATDRFVLNAAKRGMRVLPLLFGEPAWASSRPKKKKASRNTYPPKDPTTYAEFAQSLARRYGPSGTLWSENPSVKAIPITSYQLWNEPNLPIYWGGKASAKAYAKLVVAASSALRQVQPAAYVVSAGIPDAALGIKPKTYIRAMLRAGAGPSLNAIGVHPYAIDVKSVMKITRRARAAINAVGGKRLAIWVTEFGWAAGGPKSPARTVSYGKQGRLIAAAFRSLAAARTSLKLRGIVYYAWRDSKVYKGGKDFWGLHTGMLRRNGKSKPALKVVIAAMRKLK